MTDVLETINSWVWSPALVYLCLAAGLYFTIRTRVVQLRAVGDMVRLMFHPGKSDAGVSSFQALSMSLAGRVGTGNIAGVATAIAFGGPGAVFWMWMVAFLGASTSFVESTLGQMFKEKDHQGHYRGGPAYYIEKCMGQRWYALLFAAVTVVATGVLLPGIQANGIAASMNTAWGLPEWSVAIAVVIALSFIVVGGVKRIAAFAGVVVPFMAVVYIGLALVVVLVNASAIPDVLRLILSSAWGLDAGFGAVVGLAIEWGVKRGIYSNEAGQGTGPHAAAAAEVSHPAKQGLVQAFSVYIDTLFVCSATAFLILSTGMYKVWGGGGSDGEVLHDGFAGAQVEAGPAFAQAAFDTLWSGAGASFIAISLTFFAFTTVVAYYYMAETNINYLLRDVSRPGVLPVATRFLQLFFLVAVAYGAVSTAGVAWTLGDIGVGVMAWLNIIAIFILQKPALLALRDYERQKRAGLDPQFDPVALGIRNATFWERRAEERTRDRVI
ncbi:alanine:cation symporter family protein [Rhodococcus triatomae]|uniref:Alanine or glycine:cation symporter, AGCS family n=1 Tax=Rhodococcus triatomae TaxID=300028 RepID=A0A1G7ZZH6_9NOCA|nr:alanine/glycine:cation symporter family protein [Rhodococcus triatomae]QNG17902.1 alanine:cation symporter family protein [Rhodococcus triatomae]QNG22430.1 alanine:cation symporter family protein [Rhodococcus triatomae]SDH14036.1 alanine or glycine:cation symporter, AGCS family [Rhodococcus triatomae]